MHGNTVRRLRRDTGHSARNLIGLMKNRSGVSSILLSYFTERVRISDGVELLEQIGVVVERGDVIR